MWRKSHWPWYKNQCILKAEPLTVLSCNVFVWNFVMRTKLTSFGKKIWQYLCNNPIYHSSYMFKVLVLKFLNLWDSNIIVCFEIFLFISLYDSKDKKPIIKNSGFSSGFKGNFIEYNCWFSNLVAYL